HNSGVIELVELSTGNSLGLLIGHTGPIRAIAFSSDGKRLVSMALDHSLRIWDLAASRQLFRYVTRGIPVSVEISSNEKYIAAMTNQELQLVPINDPSADLVIELSEGVGAGNFVAGGTRMLTTSEKGVQLWDAVTGARLERISTNVYDGAHASPD